MSNNQLLYEFLKAYLEWVYTGAESNRVFARYQALCSNYFCYLTRVAQCPEPTAELKKLSQEFTHSGLNYAHPFNHNSLDFIIESRNQTHHFNAHRIDWALNFLVTNNADLPRHPQTNPPV